MICARKQFFVHTLATMVCRTVVSGVAFAILERFVFAVGKANYSCGDGRGEGIFTRAQNDKRVQRRGRFFAGAQNNTITSNTKVSLVRLLRGGVSAVEKLFLMRGFDANLRRDNSTRRQQEIGRASCRERV